MVLNRSVAFATVRTPSERTHHRVIARNEAISELSQSTERMFLANVANELCAD